LAAKLEMAYEAPEASRVQQNHQAAGALISWLVNAACAVLTMLLGGYSMQRRYGV